MMYGRKVSFDLKPNSLNDFNRRQETEIIPILRKQKGFQDVITLVTPDKKHVQAISLWDKVESAEAYDRASFPEVTRLLASVIDGKPKVESMEVLTSTIHKATTK
jgi:hypothetical protein